MIRLATLGDIPQLIECGQKFFDESGYSDFVNYDLDSITRTFINLIEQDSGFIVVTESDEIDGMAGGLIYPFYMDDSHITGQELFWWIKPEKRGKKVGLELFQGLENTAKSLGAQTFMMVALDRLNPEQVGNMYEKCGYRKSEHTYIRRL